MRGGGATTESLPGAPKRVRRALLEGGESSDDVKLYQESIFYGVIKKAIPFVKNCKIFK